MEFIKQLDKQRYVRGLLNNFMYICIGYHQRNDTMEQIIGLFAV